MNRKMLAKSIKQRFGVKYSIQGMNIYLKSEYDISKEIKSFLEELNKEKKLGYKRFFIKEKNKSRILIISVPFGIPITLDLH